MVATTSLLWATLHRFHTPLSRLVTVPFHELILKLQLEPVKALPPFVPVKGDVFGTDIHTPVHVWDKFEKGFLEQNMRAATDPIFAKLLKEVSLGNCTDNVLEELSKRRIFKSTDREKPPDPLHPNFVEQVMISNRHVSYFKQLQITINIIPAGAKVYVVSRGGLPVSRGPG